MKLLRSTFIAFCAASSASAFAPQFASHSKSLSNASYQRKQSTSTTSLFVGIHEQPASQFSEEDIRREEMFVQVLKEVGMAKEYLSYLVEESNGGDASESTEEEGGASLGEVLAEKAAAGEVELFGGGGDAASTAETPKEAVYQPALRTDLGSTVLLSGTADASLLTILNNNFFGAENVPNFDFGIIRALVEDPARAKKQAISREARYSGLLDKLVIEPASSGSVLPTKEELTGATSWIVQLTSKEASAMLPKIAESAKASAELKNLVVLVTGSSSGSVEGWDAVVDASGDGEAFTCTLLAVGELYAGGKEGGFYHVGPLGDDALAPSTSEAPKLSSKMAYQLLGHALALESTSNTALTAYEYPPAVLEAIVSPYGEGDFANRDDDGNELPDEFKDIKMESRMIQAMREVGFTQVMELDVLAGKGISALKKYIENPPNKENAFTKVKSARDLEDEKIMAMLDEEIAKSEAQKKAEADAKKKIEVEGIAKEWSIKEYSLQMLGGDLDESVSEKDFMISNWDKALAEAEATWERINSEEYISEQERLKKNKVNSENKLFWDGMPSMLRKKREKMVEKVKQQYMDLLSEEDLERIILNE